MGTTNTLTGFLRDVTGNRRFWPVVITGGGIHKPWEIMPATVGQVWAEALSLYHAGEELILKGVEAEMAIEMQQEALENDDREGLVQEYLNKLLPVDWNKMSISERRMYLSGDEFATSSKPGTVKRDKVCNLELWAECFGKDPAAIKRQDSYELTAIMNKMDGWRRYEGNKAGKLSFSYYGPQCAYVREATDSAAETSSNF